VSKVTRTIVIKSVQFPRRVFRVFVELEGMYRNMVEQLTLFAVRSNIASFTRLKALKYRELRSVYPQLPSHYAYTACQDTSVRAKSFLRLKRRGLAEKEYPEVRSVSIWLDDHLWKLDGLTSIQVATHKGWVRVGLEPHKIFWKYINSGWRISSEAKIKLDKRSRRLIIYITFRKCVESYKPRGYITVDVNENHVAVLVNRDFYLFETGLGDIVLGYYYRRKKIQEKYDRLHGVDSRVKKKVLRKLRERKRKNDLRWKLANIVVRVAREKQNAIVLERLGKNPARGMINHVRDDQLRHRIYQASFRGVQRAIEEKAREHGVPVIYVNPRNTSKLCPVHGKRIVYSNGDRIGRCSVGGELWHRDAVACWNLLFRASRGDGSNAPSLGRLFLDGSLMPLGSTAAHELTLIAREAWVRWKSLDATKKYKQMRINI